jgi:hypothetical protein
MLRDTEIQKKKNEALSSNDKQIRKSTFQKDFEKGIPLEIAKQKLLTKVRELWSS